MGKGDFQVGARVAVVSPGEAVRVTTISRTLKPYFHTEDGCVWGYNGRPRGRGTWDRRRVRLATTDDEKAAKRTEAEQWMRYQLHDEVDTDVMIACVAAMRASIRRGSDG